MSSSTKTIQYICSTVIRDALRNGSVNFPNLIQDLNAVYGGTNGYVFLADRTVGEKLSCAFSTDRRKYVNGSAYNAEDLPANQFLIFNRVDLNAIVCFDGQPEFEMSATDEEREHLHDCISLGILMCHRKSWSEVEVAICNTVAEKIGSVTDVVKKWCRPVQLNESSMQRHNQSLGVLMSEVRDAVASSLTMLYELADYVELDTNTLRLVPERRTIEEVVTSLSRTSNVKVVPGDDLPPAVTVDLERLTQAVVGVTRRFRAMVVQVQLSTDVSRRLLKVYVQTSSPLLPKLMADHLSTPGLSITLSKLLCVTMGGSFNIDKEGPGAVLMFLVA